MKISGFSLAVTVAGTFIGAGFVSGQELWQFFGTYGKSGMAGFVLAIVVMTLLSGITLYYAKSSGNDTFDKVVCFNDSRAVRSLISVFQFVFYIGLYVIMAAGVQSLVSQYFSVSRLLVGIIFCSAVTVIALKGIKWLTSVFSAIIPLLIIATVIISVCVLTTTELKLVKSEDTNSLLSGWPVSALVYVSYNFFAAIGVFAALGRVKATGHLMLSVALGGTLLLVLGLTILLPVSATDSGRFDMPMLNVAHSLHPAVSVIYAILLFLAMLGAGISSLLPIVEWTKSYFPKRKTGVFAVAMLVSATAVFLSLFGFSELIGTVYPIFGYVGFVIIIIVIVNFIKHVRRKA